MTDNNQTEDKTPAGSGEAQQDVAQSGNANGEATSTAKASDELSEEALQAVAGGGPQGHMRKSDWKKWLASQG